MKEPEHAAGFLVGLCDDPNCGSIHVKLVRRNGSPVAYMAIGVRDVPAILEKMRDLAYQIVTTKEAELK